MLSNVHLTIRAGWSNAKVWFPTIFRCYSTLLELSWLSETSLLVPICAAGLVWAQPRSQTASLHLSHSECQDKSQLLAPTPSVRIRKPRGRTERDRPSGRHSSSGDCKRQAMASLAPSLHLPWYAPSSASPLLPVCARRWSLPRARAPSHWEDTLWFSSRPSFEDKRSAAVPPSWIEDCFRSTIRLDF